MFPFRGMPRVGAVARQRAAADATSIALVRGILLKGNDWPDLWPSLWPLIVFALVVMTIAVRFYRQDARLKARLADRSACALLAPAAPSARTFARPIRPRSIATSRSAAGAIGTCDSCPSATFPPSGGRCSARPRSTRSCSGRSRGSPTLDQARARLVAGAGAAHGARGRHAVSAGRPRPRAPSASASILRPSAFRRRPIPGPFNVFSLGVNASYNFDIFGGTRRELEGAGGGGRLPGATSSRRRG